MRSEKLQSVALVAEISSGVAVVVTLLVLIYQVNQNTQAVRSATYDSLVADLAESREKALVLDERVSDVFFKLFSEQKLTEKEVFILKQRAIATFQHYERAYVQYHSGNLGEEHWDRFNRSICAGVLPVALWRAEKETLRVILTDSFFNYLSRCYDVQAPAN